MKQERELYVSDVDAKIFFFLSDRIRLFRLSRIRVWILFRIMYECGKLALSFVECT
jgi:hypothetical protein